jgi:hypothetical protein
MSAFAEKYRSVWNKRYIYAVLAAFGFLACALIINFYAAKYATLESSSPVTDIILSNTRVYDVDVLFVYGPILFWIIVSILFISEPKAIPFGLKSIALFVVIRSVFITLTHIGPFPTQVTIDSTGLAVRFLGADLVRTFFTGNDLFFSGHTGLPFLLALIFWNRKYLRYFFIAASVFFGVIVLLGHLHYSIDVLSAFFITYSIYKIAERFFDTDRALFLKEN